MKSRLSLLRFMSRLTSSSSSLLYNFLEIVLEVFPFVVVLFVVVLFVEVLVVEVFVVEAS